MLTNINVDEPHLQADLIKSVGIGGEFLTAKETLKYTRNEYVPQWPPHGVNLLESIHSEAKDILQTHQSPALPDGALERIQEILKEADESLVL